MAMPSKFASVPKSTNTVKVSVINTAVIENVNPGMVLDPVIPSFKRIDIPSFSFVIEHNENGTYLFDLGLRKDWENLLPSNVNFLKTFDWRPNVQKDVSDVLEEQGVKLEDIKGVFWSHHHFDHVGRMSAFPASTSLFVGRDFLDHFLPGYPTNPDGEVDEEQFKGRTCTQMDFEKHEHKLKIGQYDAIDFFADGSLYLLDSPGHTVGHMACLCRTSPNHFLLLAGDTCHYTGAFRPTAQTPLPEIIKPNPLHPLQSEKAQTGCPCEIFERFHPDSRRDEPFLVTKKVPDGQGPNHNRAEALKTRDKMFDFDAAENVLVIIAHDTMIGDVLDKFPQPLNGWEEKNLKQLTQWRFLAELVDVQTESSVG